MARAHAELSAHSRSWMVTLTASPENHFRFLIEAERKARSKGVSPEEWTASQTFAARADGFGIEVTKWLKRLRARGASFNYLMVVEAHKSGLPHVHLLIHERAGCSWRTLTDPWLAGFSHAKLVEGPEAARYVTKYLVKSAAARVRASLHYGNTPTLGRPSEA